MTRYSLWLSLTLAACQAHAPAAGRVDALAMYRKLTQVRAQLSEEIGDPYELPESNKLCVQSTCKEADTQCEPTDHFAASPVLRASHAAAYYGLSDGRATSRSQLSESSGIPICLATLRRLFVRMFRTRARSPTRT